MAICWLRWRSLQTCTHVEDMEILQMKHRFRNESALAVSHWCSQQNSDGVPKQHLQEVEAPSSLAVLKAGYLLYSKTIYIVILQGHISTNSPIYAAPFSSAVRYLCLYLEFFGVVSAGFHSHWPSSNFVVWLSVNIICSDSIQEATKEALGLMQRFLLAPQCYLPTSTPATRNI